MKKQKGFTPHLLAGKKGTNFVSCKKVRGFTLVELLVVIAIIGLLSTLAVVALNNARQKARDARRVSDIKQLQTSLELYYNDVNSYPIAAVALDTKDLCLSSTNALAAACAGTTYMSKIPGNPSPQTDGGCAAGNYMYTSADGTTYTLTYCLGAATGGIIAGPHTASPAGIQ